jgi:hypothetical protein
MASQGYWTPHDTHIPQGMTAYHRMFIGNWRNGSSSNRLIPWIKISPFDYGKIRLRIHACTWHCGAHNLDMNKPNLIE